MFFLRSQFQNHAFAWQNAYYILTAWVSYFSQDSYKGSKHIFNFALSRFSLYFQEILPFINFPVMGIIKDKWAVLKTWLYTLTFMLTIHESDIIKIFDLWIFWHFTTKLSKQYHEHIQLPIFRSIKWQLLSAFLGARQQINGMINITIHRLWISCKIREFVQILMRTQK